MTSLLSTAIYSAEVIKSLVSKLKKDDLESYIVWNGKFTAKIVFYNLSHVIDMNYMVHVMGTTAKLIQGDESNMEPSLGSTCMQE